VSATATDPLAAGVRHLLVVQLGPVQDFIVQARRTRDLWFGSHLLSELSRAAAKAAAAHGALIFPALDASNPELDPCDTLSPDAGPPVSIANKIVVELRAEPDPGVVAMAIRTAVDARWRAIADKVRNTHEADLADDIEAVWNEQIGSLVEYTAAWAPIDRDYAAVRRQVEAAIGGRKRLRDFASIRHHRDRAPASSLDGGRVSVLAPPGTRRGRCRACGCPGSRGSACAPPGRRHPSAPRHRRACRCPRAGCPAHCGPSKCWWRSRSSPPWAR